MPKYRPIAAWMTFALLLMQTVCAGMDFGCGCGSLPSPCKAGEEDCCCSGEEAFDAGTCSHCSPVSEFDDSHRSDGNADGFQRVSVCHCGEFTPRSSEEQGIPDASESVFKHLLAAIVSGDECIRTRLIFAPTLGNSQVPSHVELTHNYKQVVLCVWLT
ncbi:hypothetical protein [Thalassoglobus neptunius]|uniref:hypothetical protein n=1 Tax=Thalassoglobus neptunius TaxID=1938619 RepID=UPI0011B3C0B7|nr:hypothetical protein [Thalassoglobus neptunius]